MIAYTEYNPSFQVQNFAVVDLRIVDVASGEIARFRVHLLTDGNVPVWMPSGDALLVNTVQRP